MDQELLNQVTAKANDKFLYSKYLPPLFSPFHQNSFITSFIILLSGGYYRLARALLH